MLIKFENLLKKIELGIIILLFSGVIMAMFMAIILRNFATADWALSFNEIVAGAIPNAVLAIGFLGASIGITRGETIAIELLNRLYPKKVRHWVIRINYLVVTALLTVFLIIGFNYLSGLEKGIDDGRLFWMQAAYLPLFMLLIAKSILVIIRPLRAPAAPSGLDNNISKVL